MNEVGATSIRVWDPLVRLFHWALVVSFFIAWYATEEIGFVHETAGYCALALIAIRVVWGFVGAGHARFASFVPGPRHLSSYLRALLARREPRHLGHNPAGALMILFLMTTVAGIGVTGWMMTLDAWWGNETVETLHVRLVDLCLIAVVIHVAANVYASARHRENLVWSMVTGTKRRG